MTMDGAFMSGVLDRHRASSALTAEVNPGPEWHVRLFLLDAVQPAIDDLSVFRHLVHVGAPALHSAYLVRQVRSRVAATERARLARELHDGVLQSLIALELEVEALRRVAGEGQVWETRLHNLRDQLRHRIAEIRDLMLRLRVNEMAGADLSASLPRQRDAFVARLASMCASSRTVRSWDAPRGSVGILRASFRRRSRIFGNTVGPGLPRLPSRPRPAAGESVSRTTAVASVSKGA